MISGGATPSAKVPEKQFVFKALGSKPLFRETSLIVHCLQALFGRAFRPKMWVGIQQLRTCNPCGELCQQQACQTSKPSGASSGSTVSLGGGGVACGLLSEQVSQGEGPSLQPSSPFPAVQVLLRTRNHSAPLIQFVDHSRINTWFSEDNQIVRN